jgi:NADPH:quinone reductase-like Zn-dependent oxidoreductase
VFYTVTADLSLPLPWPSHSALEPSHANSPILIWGGASSCGQYALQIPTHWGYKNLLATASPQNRLCLRYLGAAKVFNYRDPRVENLILKAAAELPRRESREGGQDGPTVPFVIDCIGSKAGSLAHIAKIAQKGTRVAVLLPVILKNATSEEAPEYTFDVDSSAQ